MDYNRDIIFTTDEKERKMYMTNMKRMSISIPPEMESAIVGLRRTERFCRSSYAEIIREVLGAGLNKISFTHEENVSSEQEKSPA